MDNATPRRLKNSLKEDKRACYKNIVELPSSEYSPPTKRFRPFPENYIQRSLSPKICPRISATAATCSFVPNTHFLSPHSPLAKAFTRFAKGFRVPSMDAVELPLPLDLAPVPKLMGSEGFSLVQNGCSPIILSLIFSHFFCFLFFSMLLFCTLIVVFFVIAVCVCVVGVGDFVS